VEFPIEKINKIDLAILRLAIYELLVVKKEPPRVIIDEAIELPHLTNGTYIVTVNGEQQSTRQKFMIMN
jgi:hypothetical protein